MTIKNSIMTSFPRKYIRAYACAFFIMTAASSTMQGQSLEQQFEKLMFSREQQQDTHAYAAHSHNDYWQPQPFFTAYYAGMQSIEADRSEERRVGKALICRWWLRA